MNKSVEIRSAVMGIKEYLNADEAAAYLGVSNSFIYGAVFNKIIPHCKPTRGTLLLKKSDLNAWIESGRVQTK